MSFQEYSLGFQKICNWIHVLTSYILSIIFCPKFRKISLSLGKHVNFIFFFFFYSGRDGTQGFTRARQGKCSTTELHAQPLQQFVEYVRRSILNFLMTGCHILFLKSNSYVSWFVYSWLVEFHWIMLTRTKKLTFVFCLCLRVAFQEKPDDLTFVCKSMAS